MIAYDKAHDVSLAVLDDFTAVLTIGRTSAALSGHDLQDLASVATKVYREARETADNMELEHLVVKPDA